MATKILAGKQYFVTKDGQMLPLEQAYTPWRKFLAWVGFITLTLLATGFIYWGVVYIKAAI